MAFSDAALAGANIKQSRDAIREEKRRRDQELQRQGYSFDKNNQMSVREGSAAEAEQLQALEATQLAKTLQGKLAAQETDQALEDFGLTGDASYLQRAMDNNPYLKKAWADKGVQLVNGLDFENDGNLLARSGLKPSAYDTPEKRDVVKRNLYKVYNGKEWSLGLLNNAVMETGAARRLGPRRAQPLMDNFEQFQGLVRGPRASGMVAEGHKYEKEIMAASQETGLPPDVIAAVMDTESSNNPNAVSSKGARGLMQLMEDAANEVGVTDRDDPAQNIMGGAKYLKKQLDTHGGDLQLALAAYNAGPGNVQKYGGIPPFGETQQYVQKIIKKLDNGQQYYGNRADTILNHMRDQANAKKGLTTKQVDDAAAADLETARVSANAMDRGIDQKDRALNQDDRRIDQADRELDLKAEGNQIEVMKQNVKMLLEGTTTKEKELNAAVDKTTEMLQEFGGEEQFFNTDFSDPEKYKQAYKYVNQIEQLSGEELTQETKKKIGDLRKLIALGDPAKNLTPADTGLIDNTMKGVQKYFSDNVKGTEARSAYSAYRNTLRNALFGSALTEAEINAFNDAYGTLGAQAGPVLQQFKTALIQTKAELESVSQLMNPYTAQVRLGADNKRMGEIMTSLDARIKLIDDTISGTGSKEGKQAVINAFEG